MHLSDFILYYYGFNLLLNNEQYDLIEKSRKDESICFIIFCIWIIEFSNKSYNEHQHIKSITIESKYFNDNGRKCKK